MPATTISDLSNADNKDGMLKDVYIDRKKKKAKEGRKSAEKLLQKTRFGPYKDGN